MIKKIISLLFLFILCICYANLVNIKYFKKYNRDLTSNVQDFFLSSYSNGFNSNIYYRGNLITTNDKIDILIGNHFNYIDFVIHIGIFKNLNNKEVTFLYTKNLGETNIINDILKETQSLSLNKKIHLDIENIKNFVSKNNNTIIYFNPEGQRIKNITLEKSKEFCKENNLTIYNNILYPKMKGIFTIITELRRQNKLGNIIDFTVKVENTNINNYTINDYINLNLGNTYCDINTYSVPNITDYEKFKKWFLMIWDKKENYLENYKKLNYTQIIPQVKTSNKIITFIILFIYFNVIYILSTYQSNIVIMSKYNVSY